MMKIVSFTICPFVQRVTALLEAKQLTYEVEYIRLDQKPDWFLDLSPNGQVPLLITDSGAVLFESGAIVEYIDEESEPLEGIITPEQRALNRAWSYMASKHYMAQCGNLSANDPSTFEERSVKFSKVYQKAEQQLAQHEGAFFNGSTLGNVDLAWLPLLYRAHLVEKHTGYDFLKRWPRVKQWQKALIETGIPEASVSDSFEEKFIGYYLSEKTYLGAQMRGFCLPVERRAGCTEASNCCS